MQQFFYDFIKIWVSLSLKIFCRQVIIYHPKQLKAKGPVIIASNHPNSFFDAILIGAYMQQPVHYITRGDVFNKRWARFILGQLNMIPIFRLREGKDKLSLNQETFDRSVEVLRNNGVLLIFVEGFCEHQTTLAPLKKGAPRILLSCWQQGINAGILPVWLSHHSFFSFGKKTSINLGNISGRELIPSTNSDAEAIKNINNATAYELTKMSSINHNFFTLSTFMYGLLLLPACTGWLLNYPLYIVSKAIIYPRTKYNHHYDSVMFAALTLIYPFYVICISLTAFFLSQNVYSFLLIFLLPLLARCYVIWKR